MASTSSGNANKTSTCYLKKTIGSPVGELYPLTGTEIEIGRTKKSGIYIPDPNISRSHCLLKYNSNGWCIKDLKSVNGTYIAESCLDPGFFQPLTDGDCIYLGPPREAPAGFVFLKNKIGLQGPLRDKNGSQQRISEESENPTLPGSKTGCNVPRKRTIVPDTACESGSASPSNVPAKVARISLRNKMFILPEQPEQWASDNSSISDCSISSLDSLRTRIRKNSSMKKNRQQNRPPNNNEIGSSSPRLRPASYNPHDVPSTSAQSPNNMPRAMTDFIDKMTIANGADSDDWVFDNLSNGERISSQKTIENEDHNSESLLNESRILMDCDPYPFSEPQNSDATSRGKKDASSEKALLPFDIDTKEKGFHEIVLKEKLKRQKLKTKLKEADAENIKLIQLVKDLKEKSKEDFKRLLEEELICNICTEVFIKAVTLGCSHTFCEHCITEWKKKQKKCPMCREKISSETKVLVLDSFVNKALEHLDKEYQEKRQEVISNREGSKVKQTRGAKRGRRRLQSPSPDRRLADIAPISSNINPLQSVLEYISGSQFIEDVMDGFGDGTASDDSEASVEGSGFYGGYGRCYNCGRSGHWANGCPY